jgi:hypothetical protein
MGTIVTKPPSPQGSINERDYIQTRRKIEKRYKIRKRFDKTIQRNLQ